MPNQSALTSSKLAREKWGALRISEHGIWRVLVRVGLNTRSGGPSAMTALQRDLDEYLASYNHDRAHTGRLTKGRVPADIVFGARKTRPVSCRANSGLGRA
jgi:hypothetical protein